MLLVHDNFSDAIRSRIELGKDVPSWDLKSSTIEIRADKSSMAFCHFKDFLS